MKSIQNRPTLRRAGAMISFVLLLPACASMDPGYETPSVSVSSFRAIPSTGSLPNFEIGLRVLNPNARPLELRGISFSVSLNGQSLIKGVGNELPVIDGYGAGDFTVTAAANLLGGIRFLGNLMSGPQENLQYEFKAKLDVGAFKPAVRIRDAGEIDLRPALKAQ